MNDAALGTVPQVERRWHPYPAYKDSGIEWLGKIPAHWQVKRLKFLAGVRPGVAKGRDLRDREVVELPYLRVANVQDGYLDLSDIAMIAVGLDEVARYRLQRGDVLMNEGGDFDKLGRGTVWEGIIDPCLHQNHVFAVRPRTLSDAKWISTITLTHYAKHYFILKSKQSTNLASISSTNLKELPVILPPDEERKVILDFLDRETTRVDTLIAKKERLIALLTEKRTALISHAVTKGLDPTVPMKDSGVEWIGEIPAHWDLSELRRYWKIIDCKHRTATYVDDGIPIVSTTEVKPGRLSLSNTRMTTREEYLNLIEGERLPRQGDIIYSRNASLGSAAYVDTDEEFCMGQDVCLITSSDQDQLFLTYQLNSPVVLQQLEAVMVGATFHRINVGQIKVFLVTSPPIDEQCSVANFLDRETAKIDSLIAKVREHIEKLKEYRTALISAAVTGKIDVREEVSP